MPATILSLNRGNKKSKPWLTGKHGQGASSTYQYSDLTLIASRKMGASQVAFTLVEGTWDEGAKTPTYRYLTIDGKVPEVSVSEADFQAGTLVRHIGYAAADLFNPLGENSLYGLLMRSLAEPLFPVWLEMFSLRPSKAQGYPTSRGYRRFGRVIRGTVNVLDVKLGENFGPGSQALRIGRPGRGPGLQPGDLPGVLCLGPLAAGLLGFAVRAKRGRAPDPES